MTSSKSDMSVQYIHDVYSMAKTKVTDQAAKKRTTDNKRAAAVKKAKAVQTESATGKQKAEG